MIVVTGAIKWFDVAKGFGFVVPDEEGLGDVMLHVTCLRRDGYQTALEGARIVCQAQAGPFSSPVSGGGAQPLAADSRARTTVVPTATTRRPANRARLTCSATARLTSAKAENGSARASCALFDRHPLNLPSFCA